VVVAPVSASRRLELVAAHNGGKVVLTRADASSIVRAATRSEALVAFDETGGFVWPSHLSAYDAMYTLLATVEMLVTTQSRLSELRRELPEAGHLEETVSCPWDVKGEVMRLLVDSHRNERLDLTDGLKVAVDGGWVLILPDPDRPSYRVIASVATAAAAQQELAAFVKAVSETVERSTGAAVTIPALPESPVVSKQLPT
jgi:mannose-1-phosphate guanylyltransferase/phosphomannomutase